VHVALCDGSSLIRLAVVRSFLDEEKACRVCAVVSIVRQLISRYLPAGDMEIRMVKLHGLQLQYCSEQCTRARTITQLCDIFDARMFMKLMIIERLFGQDDSEGGNRLSDVVGSDQTHDWLTTRCRDIRCCVGSIHGSCRGLDLENFVKNLVFTFVDMRSSSCAGEGCSERLQLVARCHQSPGSGCIEAMAVAGEGSGVKTEEVGDVGLDNVWLTAG
jgi:hypothetical protein